jgi:hypothetical protein
LLVPNASVKAGQVSARSINISSSLASAADVTYTIQFNTDLAGGPYDIGGIVVDFCAESPIIGDPICNTPPGFDLNLTNLAIANQSGISGFSISGSSDTNTIIITKNIANQVNPGTTIHFELGNNGANDGVVNPNLGNYSYYAKVLVYQTTTEANNYTSAMPGSYVDVGGFALSTASVMDVSTVVAPFLFFCTAQSIQGYDCTTGTVLYVNFGDFSETYTATGTSQLLILTNAGGGYGVKVQGTTLTSGNNVINTMALPNISVTGVSQFGMNLVANVNPAVGTNPVGPGSANPTVDYSNPNIFKYNSGDTIINGSGVTDWRKFTISYVVNIPAIQAPGVYTTTLTYICLANF